MRPEDVLEWVRAKPFRPFRIILNSGHAYDIRHPEVIKVGRSTMHIYTYAGEPADPYGRAEMVGLLLIERIEAIEAANPSPK